MERAVVSEEKYVVAVSRRTRRQVGMSIFRRTACPSRSGCISTSRSGRLSRADCRSSMSLRRPLRGKNISPRWGILERRRVRQTHSALCHRRVAARRRHGSCPARHRSSPPSRIGSYGESRGRMWIPCAAPWLSLNKVEVVDDINRAAELPTRFVFAQCTIGC